MRNVLLTLLLLIPIMLLGQPYFSKSYDFFPHPAGDVVKNILSVGDGYVIDHSGLCGSEGCFKIKKLDEGGEEVWTTVISEEGFSLHTKSVEGAILNQNGNILYLGNRAPFGSSNSDTFLAELDPSTGDTLNFIVLEEDYDSHSLGIIQKDNGEYLIYNGDVLTTSDTSIYVRRVVVLNEDFTFQQDIILNDDIYFMVKGNIIQDGENHFVTSSRFFESTGHFRPVAHKFDYDGNWLWRRWFSPMPNSNVVKITKRPEGFYMAYSAENNDPDKPGWMMPKIAGTDEEGNQLWSSFICTEALMNIHDMATAPNGDLLVCGLSAEGILGTSFVLRMNPDGEELWRKHIGDHRHTPSNAFNTNFFDIDVKDNGDIAIGGRLYDTLNTGGVVETKGWVVIIDPEGCMNGNCNDELILTSAKEIAQKTLKLQQYFSFYPNPVGEEVNISMWFVEPSVEAFQLYDLKGNLLSRHKLNIGLPTHQINVSDLNSGIYLLTLVDDKGQVLQTERLVKE